MKQMQQSVLKQALETSFIKLFNMMIVRFFLSQDEILEQKMTRINKKFSILKKSQFKHLTLFYMSCQVIFHIYNIKKAVITILYWQ